MENDWLSKYGVTLPEIAAQVNAACGQSSPRHREDVFDHVVWVLCRKAPVHPPLFPGKKSLLNYAYTVAKNKSKRINLSSSNGRLVGSDPATLADVLRAGLSESEQTFLFNDEKAFVTSATEDAHPELREVVRLTFEGRDPKAIAAMTGLSQSTVRRRLKEAEALVGRKRKTSEPR